MLMEIIILADNIPVDFLAGFISFYIKSIRNFLS